MARNTLPRFTNAVKNYAVDVTANSTDKTLFTGGTGGSRLSMFSITTDDTNAISLDIKLVNTATTTFAIGQIAIAAQAGTSSTPAEDGLNATDLPFVNADAHSNTYIDVMEGWSIAVSATSIDTASSRKITCCAVVNELEADS